MKLVLLCTLAALCRGWREPPAGGLLHLSAASAAAEQTNVSPEYIEYVANAIGLTEGVDGAALPGSLMFVANELMGRDWRLKERYNLRQNTHEFLLLVKDAQSSMATA